MDGTVTTITRATITNTITDNNNSTVDNCVNLLFSDSLSFINFNAIV